MSSSTFSEASTSKIVTEEEATVSSPFEGDTIELTGIPLDRFAHQQFAQIFQCNICMDIPTEAIILSNCHHVFCEHCVRHWLACNGVCPSCRQFVEAGDILPLRQQMLAMFDLLTIRCKCSLNGCEETLKISDINDHEKSCRFSRGKRKRGSYNKMKLYDVSRQGRLREMNENLSDFCESNNEEVEDVLFSMLTTTLFDKGKAELISRTD